MENLDVILMVVGMFVLRIGIPFALLIVLGTLIERRQNHRQENIAQMYVLQADAQQNEQRKAA